MQQLSQTEESSQGLNSSYLDGVSHMSPLRGVRVSPLHHLLEVGQCATHKGRVATNGVPSLANPSEIRQSGN